MSDLFRYFPRRGADDRLDIGGLLHAGLLERPAQVLLSCEGEAWTRARLARRVAALQGWLAAQGIRPGDRVALMMGNHPDHIALVYALMLSGGVWVPINTRLKAAGLQYLVDHCTPKLALVDAGLQPGWTEAQALCRHRCPALLPPAEDPQAGWPLQRHAAAPGDTLCLIYTSGTTGAPKAVQFTHRMMRVASEAALQVAGLAAGDVVFLWEPLCHIGGAQMLLAPLLQDLRLDVVAGFSASRFWRQVAASGATHLHYLGGILDILARQPRPAPGSNALRVAWGAGLNRSTWAALSEHLGVALRECYGMTECSSFATVNTNGKPGSMGRPLPWIRLQLLDAEGREVGVGEHGEVVLHSEVEGAFLPAYLDAPEATAAALRGGRLHTGDLAWRDADGDLFFVGRNSDSMRVRGENVSAWEVERVLATHPQVQAVAVVGLRSEVGEQEILAFVQWREAAGDMAQLAAWARERLARFQVPRYWRTVVAFETTPSERIRKHLLPRDIASAWDALLQVP
jgi:crotonobetaine/carnitine-CoA ligase